MTTDPKWLEILSESYTQEVSQSVRNLHEEADQMFNLIETIETALDVDLTEAQVDALISALSESRRTSRVARSAFRRFGNSSQDPRYRLALARHDHDEIRRGPRILKRAEQMADEVLARGAETNKTTTDMEDWGTAIRNEKPLPPGASVNARLAGHQDLGRAYGNLTRRRADVAASTLDPKVALERGHNRLKLVGDITQDLIGPGSDRWKHGDEQMKTVMDRFYNNFSGQQPSDYTTWRSAFTDPSRDTGMFDKKGLKFSTGAIRTPRKNRDRKED